MCPPNPAADLAWDPSQSVPMIFPGYAFAPWSYPECQPSLPSLWSLVLSGFASVSPDIWFGLACHPSLRPKLTLHMKPPDPRESKWLVFLCRLAVSIIDATGLDVSWLPEMGAFCDLCRVCKLVVNGVVKKWWVFLTSAADLVSSEPPFMATKKKQIRMFANLCLINNQLASQSILHSFTFTGRVMCNTYFFIVWFTSRIFKQRHFLLNTQLFLF